MLGLLLIKYMKKYKLSSYGLFQALGIVLYCAIIASLLSYFGKLAVTPPELVGSTLILMLLVFSAAVCGTIVFGYPIYLALQNKIKVALQLLLFTLLYLIGLIAIFVVLSLLFI